MTCGPFLPSKLMRGSYLPGPQELKTAFVGGSSAGERATIAPTLRSRLGYPSRRLPMPGAKELSTVEWHSAQVKPTRVSVSLPPTGATVPLTPMTALSFSRAMVVAGSERLMVPPWMPATTSGGKASASTLRPTFSAVVGSTAETTWSMCRVSVHLVSSPKVSNRKVCLPSATSCALSPFPQPASPPATRQRTPTGNSRCQRRSPAQPDGLGSKRLDVFVMPVALMFHLL